MNLSDIRRVFRGAVFDTVGPRYKWSEDFVDDVANEAVMEACRRGPLIIDSDTEEICELAYNIGETVLELDPRIILIMQPEQEGAMIEGQTTPLDRMSVRNMFPGWRTQTAPIPRAYIFDWTTGSIRLWPEPTTAGTVLLRVWREPLARMVQETDEPEIPARYHMALIEGMKARAYRRPDTATKDLAQSAAAEVLFSAEFGERKSARNENWQAQHAASFSDTLC